MERVSNDEWEFPRKTMWRERQKTVHAIEYKHKKQPRVVWCSSKVKGVER